MVVCRRIVLALSLLALLARAPTALAQDAGPAAAENVRAVPTPLADFFCPSSEAPAETPQSVPSDTTPAPKPGEGAGWDCPPQPPPPPPRPPAPDLFRMVALPIGTSSSLDKWEGARDDTLADQTGPWTELLQQANSATDGHPLEMVNMWVNWHLTYREDPANSDDWSDALTTLRRGYGDCEDFALAKMALLSELGISDDDMFLVLLKDRRGVAHAVLAVRADGGFYILDNRTDRLRLAAEVTEYTPIQSFSGDFAWTYGRKLADRR